MHLQNVTSLCACKLIMFMFMWVLIYDDKLQLYMEFWSVLFSISA